LGFLSGAVEVSVVLAYGALSLGDRRPKFLDCMVVLLPTVRISIKNMDILTLGYDTTTQSHPRGMERLILCLNS